MREVRGQGRRAPWWSMVCTSAGGERKLAMSVLIRTGYTAKCRFNNLFRLSSNVQVEIEEFLTPHRSGIASMNT